MLERRRGCDEARGLRTRRVGVGSLATVVGISVALLGCSDEPTFELISGDSLSVSSVEKPVLPPTPESMSPCETQTCCEERLGVTPTDCISVTLQSGICLFNFAPDGSVCGEQGDLCAGVGACTAGACVLGLPVECATEDLGPCATVGCDPASGQCVTVPTGDGTSCGDGNACNGDEVCQAGQCQGGGPISCEGLGPCTVASCDPDVGCVYEPVEAPCDDDNPCTQGDACEDGSCEGGENFCGCETDKDCLDWGDPCEDPWVCVDEGCQPADDGPVVCDDGNDCTTESCEDGECVFEPDEGASCDDGEPCTWDDECVEGSCEGTPADCDDGNPCTDGDVCSPETGECVTGLNTCTCDAADDCPELPPCGGAWQCEAGQCALEAGTVIDCADFEPLPCHVITCDVDEGSCAQSVLPDGEACDDEDACTVGETCSGGSCNGGEPVACDDDDPCTADSCAPGAGCVFAPTSGAPCDDGSACTAGDTCTDGSCDGKAPVVCDDGDPCTEDSCDSELGCVTAPLTGAPCDDGQPCTSPDTCSEGVCGGGPNVCVCEKSEDCKDDGDLCNGVPICQDGLCVVDPDAAVVCSGGDPCVISTCTPATGSCDGSPAADATPCSDGSECTTGDLCLSGVCGGTPVVCDDGNDCTADACEPSNGCVTAPLGGPCDDGNACTEGEVCSEGACGSGLPVDCNDSNICTSDTCSSKSGCKHVPAIGGCNDGDKCTGPDACIEGECVGKGTECVGGDECHLAVCIPTTGECSKEPIDCADSDECTEDFCTAGAGCDHGPKLCDDGEVCTTDLCDPSVEGGCVFTAVGCDDGNPCTIDSCDAAGACSSENKDCVDDQKCTVDACDPETGECTNEQMDCDDGNKCTSDFCEPDLGTCAHIPTDCGLGAPCLIVTCQPATGACVGAIVQCDDSDPCTTDKCHVELGCQYTAISCDDGLACTDDACVAGECSNVPDDSACSSGQCDEAVCDAALGCVNTPVPGACDDEDAQTTADMCIDGVCAGFTQAVVKPTGAGKHNFLQHVTWSDGAFYLTGGDNGNGGFNKGWLAKLVDDLPVLIGDKLSGEHFTAITHDAAVTDAGTIRVRDGDSWPLTSGLVTAFQLLKPTAVSIDAIWGADYAGEHVYYLAGRDATSEDAWLIYCDGSGCVEQVTKFPGFAAAEEPRAMSGWVSGGVLRPTLVSDYPEGDLWSNDAFSHAGPSNSQWETTFLDLTSASHMSRDIHVTSDENMWHVGTGGLLRASAVPTPDDNKFLELVNVIPAQGSYDFHGVWSDDQRVLIVGNRLDDDGGVTLVLLDLLVGSDPANPGSWTVTELAEVPAGAACGYPICVPGAGSEPARLESVWMHDGQIVISGWIIDAVTKRPESLLMIRNP